MKFKATFHKSEQSFRSDFGEVHNISDGGYERGYAAGEKAGNSLYYATKLWGTYDHVVFPENYSLTLKMKEAPIDCYRTFAETKNLKSVKFSIENKDGLMQITQTFRASSVEVVDFTETSCKLSGDISYTFFQADNLVSILGELDLSACTNFNYSFFCGKLRDVQVKPNSIYLSIRFLSAYLTEKSRQSIIDGLADLTDSEPQTITLNGVGKLLTDEQKAQITAKNWTLAY